MKLRITHLKAPWPEGAKVGDVVELDVSAVPAWAVGKCELIHEDAEPALKADDGDPDEKAAAEALAAAEAQALAERQAIADRQAKEAADVKPEPAAKPAAGAKSAAKPAVAG